jgi:glycosyltransferase involved in cell wall biosynthesis
MQTRKRLKIAIISKLWEETSPLSKGGTGSSVGFLVNALVQKGHHVSLFATGNSQTKAQKLFFVRKKPYQNDYSEVQEYLNISTAFSLDKKFDIIHCVVEHKSVLFADLVQTPSIHSIRYGQFFAQEIDLLKRYKHLNYVANSQAVSKLLPFLNWQKIVYNGIDCNLFKRNIKKGDYLLFLARLSPQKGVDIAISLARKLKLKLIIAGKTSKTDQVFLDKKVWPFIDKKQIIYLGEVVGKKKINLLKNAYCLIQPNRLFEACSNSILEAMASAVPVLAYDNGSNRELVDHGKTGFIVSSEKEAIKCLKKIDLIKKEDCYNRIKQDFSVKQMLNNYEDLYYKIINN